MEDKERIEDETINFSPIKNEEDEKTDETP
jgi:hypothetical protein